ncbi:MAG: nucleotidyltransferase domain-containing protein [Candidatus Brockarchaeota archaeon]|nr:nucleotidyltransferase domain-containing protein [Candidatus Brockarchaeota archaeon]
MNAEPLQKASYTEVGSLKRVLSSIREPCVKAVLLFGSRARGESVERSDVDLLVLHEGCGIQDAVLRRRRLYNVLREAVGGEAGLTLIDMELQRFLNPSEVTPLLLNIYQDAIVLHDSTGSVEGFLRRVRERISESGLKRVRSGKAYHWVLPEPLKKVKIL